MSNFWGSDHNDLSSLNDIIDTAYEYSIKFHTPNNINDNVTYEIDDDSVDVKVYTVKIWDPTSNKYYDIGYDAIIPSGKYEAEYTSKGTYLSGVFISEDRFWKYNWDGSRADNKEYTVEDGLDETKDYYYDIADDAFFEYYPLGLMPYDYDEYGTKLGDVVKSHIIEVPDGCVISTDDYITLHKLTN